MHKNVKGLQARVAALEQVCAEMYQVAGAIGAPVRVLDQLSAAADARPLPSESVLPFDVAECRPLPSVAAAAMGRKGGAVTSPKKTKASRLNGQLHGGRPAKFKTGDRVRCKESAPAGIRGLVGEIVRRGSERAIFYVRFTAHDKAEAVRTWWMEKVA